MDGDCSPLRSQSFDDDGRWNCPPDPGITNACVCLSSVNSDDDAVIVEDIPKEAAADDKKSFTFGLSELSSDDLNSSKTRLSRENEEHLSSYDLLTLPGSKSNQLVLANHSAENASSEPSTQAGDKGLEKKRRRQPVSIENEFFGVYCLISRSSNKYFKNRCYIGYTVDPNRRIRQHNAGKQFGGAGKTDHRGPWDMICIIHGFPNSISALRFEWAWQNPEKSRRLRQQCLKKRSKESSFAFRIRIACHMLNSDPWRRLALTFRWLLPSEKIPFPEDIPPPHHIRIAFGLVEKVVTFIPENDDGYEAVKACSHCLKPITSLIELIRCTAEGCGSHFHSHCIAKKMLETTNEFQTHLFPVTGSCPNCKAAFFWGDLVRDQRTVIAVITAAGKRQKGSNLMIPKSLNKTP